MTVLGDPRGASPGAPASDAAVPLLWVNGRRADPRAPQISALDRGFTLADGLFETMRSYGGVVFRLDAHLARLTSGAAVLGIPLPPGLRETVEAAAWTARDEGWPDASVRLTVTRGVGGAPGVAPPAGSTPTAVVGAYPFVPTPGTSERGIAAQLAAGRRNEYASTAGLKVTAYADAVVALGAARAAGADDAIFLDTAGHLSEATASNLFVVHGGVLYTPRLACGALPGITRAAVLQCAGSLGIPAEETVLDPRMLEESDEAFLTNSVRELVPLVRMIAGPGTGQPIGAGTPGELTARLARTYAELVRTETGR